MCVELYDLLSGLFDGLYKMWVIWQIIIENFMQGKQGGYVLFIVVVCNKFVNFIVKWIVNINGIFGIINVVDVMYLVCNV